MLQNEIDTVYLIIGKAILKRMTDGISEEEIRSMIEKDIEQAGLITGTVKPEVINHLGIDVWFCECGEFILKDQKYCRFCGEIDWQGKE